MPATKTPNSSPIQSPCVKICTLDASAGLCLGCGRTLEEIARWMTMSAEDRSRVMAELPRRLARHSAVKFATG